MQPTVIIYAATREAAAAAAPLTDGLRAAGVEVRIRHADDWQSQWREPANLVILDTDEGRMKLIAAKYVDAKVLVLVKGAAPWESLFKTAASILSAFAATEESA